MIKFQVHPDLNLREFVVGLSRVKMTWPKYALCLRSGERLGLILFNLEDTTRFKKTALLFAFVRTFSLVVEQDFLESGSVVI